MKSSYCENIKSQKTKLSSKISLKSPLVKIPEAKVKNPIQKLTTATKTPRIVSKNTPQDTSSNKVVTNGKAQLK